MAAKIFKLNMNMQVDDIGKNFLGKTITQKDQEDYAKQVAEWQKIPEKTRGDRPEIERKIMNGAEFFKRQIEVAITQVYPTGNKQSLKRTFDILESMQITIDDKEKAGFVILGEDDYKYVRSAFNKADKWHNTAEIAKIVMRVAALIDKAEEI